MHIFGYNSLAMNIFNFLKTYVKRYFWRYLAGLVVLIAVDYTALLIPSYTGIVTDGLMNGTLDSSGVLRICLTILGIAVSLAVGRFFWRVFIFGAARGVERDIRNDLFEHMESLSTEYYNENKTGDLMAYFTNDLNAIRMMSGYTVLSIIDAVCQGVFVLTRMIFYVSGKLTLFTLIPMSVIAVGCFWWGKLEEVRYDRKQKAFAELSDKVQESLSGIRVIKAFNQEKAELASFMESNENCRQKNIAVGKLMAYFWPALDGVIGLCMLLTLLIGGSMALTGEITLGKYIAFNSYVMMLVWPMIAVGDSINTATQGIAASERIMKVMNVQPVIVDRKYARPADTFRGEIDLDHLTYAYPKTKRNVLEDVTVHIAAGETMAIIGRTGSGKSTIANLLMRVYDAKDDAIRIDGKDLKKYTLDSLRKNIAYVPQDNFLFSDTIENNIAFGIEYEGMPEEERLAKVMEAAKKACIHDNIMEFPDGYQTVVGERGATISGGQKQRSSIARALLKDAPILILDDSLSAVDTDTEKEILANLKKDREGKTTIIIAHRLSSVRNADHILVLEDGRKAEYGTHDELMALNGIYHEIFMRQQLASEINEDTSLQEVTA